MALPAVPDKPDGTPMWTYPTSNPSPTGGGSTVNVANWAALSAYITGGGTAGDVVVLAPGSYGSRQIDLTQLNGTAANPITFTRNWTLSDNPVFEGTGTTTGPNYALQLTGSGNPTAKAGHAHFWGIEFTNSFSWVIQVGKGWGADPSNGAIIDVNFRYCWVHEAGQNLVHGWSDLDTVGIEDSTLEGSGRRAVLENTNFGSGCYWGQDTQDQTSTNLWCRRNHIHDINNGPPVNIKAGLTNVEVDDNLIYDADVKNQGGITLAINTINYGGRSPGMTARRNVIYDIRRAPIAPATDGEGIVFGESVGITVESNLVFDCRNSHGILGRISGADGPSTNTSGSQTVVQNNTVWQTGEAGEADIRMDFGVSLIENVTQDGSGITAVADDFVGPLSGSWDPGPEPPTGSNLPALRKTPHGGNVELRYQPSPTGGGSTVNVTNVTELANYLATGGTPGDVVLIDPSVTVTDAINGAWIGGTDRALSVSNLSGTAGNPIILTSSSLNSCWKVDAGGNWPTGGVGAGTGIDFQGASYVEVWGCEVTEANLWGVTFARSYNGDTAAFTDNCALRWSKVHRCIQEGVVAHHCTQIEITQNEIFDCGQIGSTNNFGELIYLGNGNDFNNHTTNNILIHQNYGHDSFRGEGVDIKPHCTQVTVTENTFEDVIVWAQGCINVHFNNGGTDYGGLDPEVYILRNVIGETTSVQGATGDGCGIWNNQDFGVRIESNIIFNNESAGLVYEDAPVKGRGPGFNVGGPDCTVEANTFYGNGGPSEIHIIAGTEPWDYADNLTSDGSKGSGNAADSDFVGPVTGAAIQAGLHYGSGFELRTATFKTGGTGAVALDVNKWPITAERGGYAVEPVGGDFGQGSAFKLDAGSALLTAGGPAGATVDVNGVAFASEAGAYADGTVVANPPVADFGFSTNNLVVDFTDLSTNMTAAFDPRTWTWDFGDTNTSNAQNPQHTYAGSGTYTVTLTVTNVDGSDNTSKQVTVAAAPPAAAVEVVSVTDSYIVGSAWQLTVPTVQDDDYLVVIGTATAEANTNLGQRLLGDVSSIGFTEHYNRFELDTFRPEAFVIYKQMLATDSGTQYTIPSASTAFRFAAQQYVLRNVVGFEPAASFARGWANTGTITCPEPDGTAQEGDCVIWAWHTHVNTVNPTSVARGTFEKHDTINYYVGHSAWEIYQGVQRAPENAMTYVGGSTSYTTGGFLVLGSSPTTPPPPGPGPSGALLLI